MTADGDRLYWTNELTTFVNSVDKLSGRDLVADVAGSTNLILAFADDLQPFPGELHQHVALIKQTHFNIHSRLELGP